MEPTKLVFVMKGMENNVRWPEKLKNIDKKYDATKWYEFHDDHGHNIADYVALYLKVAKLLKKGHIQDLLTNMGKGILAL